jgi:hypothetical protein
MARFAIERAPAREVFPPQWVEQSRFVPELPPDHLLEPADGLVTSELFDGERVAPSGRSCDDDRPFGLPVSAPA